MYNSPAAHGGRLLPMGWVQWLKCVQYTWRGNWHIAYMSVSKPTQDSPLFRARTKFVKMQLLLPYMLLLTGHNDCLLGPGQALPFTVDGAFYHSRHVEHALPIPCVVIRVKRYEQEASQQSDISLPDMERFSKLSVRSSSFHYIHCDITRFRWRVDANRPILYPWIWSGQLLSNLQ